VRDARFGNDAFENGWLCCAEAVVVEERVAFVKCDEAAERGAQRAEIGAPIQRKAL